MATKTFTNLSVLTASDANTYLANAGLDYISESTVTGTTTNSVTLSGCFSSLYDAYRVTINGSVASMYIRLRDTSDFSSAQYYYNYSYVYYDGTSSTGGGTTSTTSFLIQSSALALGPPPYASTTSAIFDFYNPNKTVQKTISYQTFDAYTAFLGTAGMGCIFGGGVLNNTANAFTGFTLSADFATATNYLPQNLVIRVYGFRQP